MVTSPQPVTRADLLNLLLEVHHELAVHANDFDDPEYSIMELSLQDTSDLIHEMVADALADSAQKIKKITEAIQVQTTTLNTVKTNLQNLANFVGQAASVINAATQFLPYLA